nr:MAG TPA: hypothetical protein [Caudoviricetes sp.]
MLFLLISILSHLAIPAVNFVLLGSLFIKKVF